MRDTTHATAQALLSASVIASSRLTAADHRAQSLTITMLAARCYRHAAPMAGEAFRVAFEPHVDRRESDHSYWHISADDGGTADIYAAPAGETLDSLMISRFSPGLVLDMLVKFIGLADAVVLPPGCPTLLAHEGQRHHLPEELRADAVVVEAGSDVERLLQNC